MVQNPFRTFIQPVERPRPSDAVDWDLPSQANACVPMASFFLGGCHIDPAIGLREYGFGGHYSFETVKLELLAALQNIDGSEREIARRGRPRVNGQVELVPIASRIGPSKPLRTPAGRFQRLLPQPKSRQAR